MSPRRQVRRLRSGIVASTMSIVFLLAVTSPAMAAHVYKPAGQLSKEFRFLLANGVAVNDHNGHIYVADSEEGQVDDLASPTDTSPDVWSGSDTPAGPFGSHLAVAVDNSTGDVYVADREHAVIDKFDQDGNLIKAFGDTSPTQDGQLAGLKTPAGSFRPPETNYSSFGIAVDQTDHDLYVIDARHSVIDVFDENGTYLPSKQITATPSGLFREGGEYATGIAVTSSGTVYVADWGGTGLVFQFDSSGNYVRTLNGSNTTDGDFTGECCQVISVAAEDATEKLFVGTEEHAAFDVFNAEGDPLPPQGLLPSIGYLTGTAVDQATGDVYLSAYSYIAVLEPLTAPDITVGAPSTFTATTAVLNGHVDPATGEGGGPITGCHFELTSSGGAMQVPCEQQPPYPGATDVSATASGLTPGTEYHERLIAENSEASNSEVGEDFSSAGRYALSSQIGSLGDGDGQFRNPADVAADESSGDVYVADTGNHRVVKLDSAGNFVAAWGWGVSDGSATSQVCTSSCRGGIAGGEPGQLTTPSFIEVDNSGGPSAHDVYVADTSDDVVQKFDQSGHLITSWGTGGAQSYGDGIAGIAVDSDGALIVQPGSGNGIALDSFGNVLQGPIAVDTTTNDRYVDTGAAIQLSNSSGVLYDTFGQGVLNSAEGLALDHSASVLYAANSGADAISAFTARRLPEVTTAAVNNPGPTTATLTGHVDPSGAGSITDCHFEYGTDLTYSLGSVPCSPTVPLSNPSDVSAEVTGLSPFTSYHFRLVATGSNDLGLTSDSRDRTFTPSAGSTPAVDATTSAEVTPTTATLEAQINPNLAKTIYRFQYGPDTTYGSQTLPSDSIGEDAVDHSVAAIVTSLEPATTYHYRVIATNFNGVSYGPDGIFTTPSVPSVSQESASGVTDMAATLSASILPGFTSTTYHFEYGLSPSYGASTPESSSIGSDNSAHAVSAALSGLTPLTTYHYRVVAVNAFGTVDGPDHTFVTMTSPSPPPPTPTTCKAGRVKKHGKCVKRHPKGRGKHHRHSNGSHK